MIGSDIEDAAPGKVFVIHGELWMRLANSQSHHMEGCIVNMTTGDWSHWSKMVLWDEEIA